ncbi:glycosyltransferase [Halomonas alkaliantarctica]|nr:glycosyltransferase [Halomonas alkaliantarctica]
MPVYEHWHLIPGLLQSLSEQTVAQENIEVLLIDNGSESIELPASMLDNVTVYTCEALGSYAARNIGVQHARGTWLCFTDADCRPVPHWLARYERYIKERDLSQEGLLTGPIQMTWNADGATRYELYDAMKGVPQKRYYRRGYAATANLLIGTATMAQVGGFDTQRFSGGDAAFCRRAQALGATLHWVEAATVRHPARKTWREIATKARRIKGGQWANPPKTRYYYTLRTFSPPLLECWRLLSKTDFSLRDRVIACLIQFRLWGVEMKEIAILMSGRQAERK